MRLSLALIVVLVRPSFAAAQSEETVRAIERQLVAARAAKWVLECEAPGGGFYHAPPKADAKPRPSLRATNGAVRALKYLGFPLLKSEREVHAKFVLSCYDPKTGAFAEPGGKPDVTITSIGVMVAAELDIPHDKYAKAMDYLKENAKTFEEVRIGAAAVEAWGVKDCPFDWKPWVKVVQPVVTKPSPDPLGGGAREQGSAYAFLYRLGLSTNDASRAAAYLKEGQWTDGGWLKAGEKTADVETTYRVMRALMLLKEKPKDAAKLRAFLDSHRNADGGFATKPGDPSSMSGAYYCAIVSKWLDDMEKK